MDTNAYQGRRKWEFYRDALWVNAESVHQSTGVMWTVGGWKKRAGAKRRWSALVVCRESEEKSGGAFHSGAFPP